MPVLDLELWMEGNVIRHGFYKKNVSNEFTIMKKSALSESTKTNTLFMECYRRIVNCDQHTPWSEIAGHLSKYANTMRMSGYPRYQRYHSIKGAIERYRDMKRDIKVGSRKSLYRNGDEIRQARIDKKDWSNTWFLQGNTINTISCPVTPGAELKKKT